jgi:hypothetical protein
MATPQHVTSFSRGAIVAPMPQLIPECRVHFPPEHSGIEDVIDLFRTLEDRGYDLFRGRH